MNIANSFPGKFEYVPFHLLLMFIGTAIFAFTMTACYEPTEPRVKEGSLRYDSVPMEPDSHEVLMDNEFFFIPTDRVVEAGTTVRWVNRSDSTHIVTSGPHDHQQFNGLFQSGEMIKWQEFSYTFEEPGEYQYFCENHTDEYMMGTIIVTDKDGNRVDNGNNKDSN